MTAVAEIIAQFQDDLRRQILETLPHSPDDRSTLDGLSTSDLLIKHMNWTSRHVIPRRRRVHISAALAGKRPLSSGNEEQALTEIIDMLLEGADVTAHLSRGISAGVDLRPVKSKARRRDLDLMLNDWGVHHLHLSRVAEADGFVRRTESILFAAFVPDDAYLIDIADHGPGNPNVWTSVDVLRIMAREWPAAGLILEMEGALPDGKAWSDADRRILRANGYATSIDIDGKVFMPRLGLTTAGTSTLVSIRAMRIMRHLPLMAEEIATGRGGIWDAMSSAKIDSGSANFRCRIYIDGYGLAEETSQTFIWMGRW